MTLTITRERIRVPLVGGDGSLAGELAYPESGAPEFACLVVGPHPHMGGSMSNALVATICAQLGAVAITLRFDYRGTGASDGSRLDLTRSLAEFWRCGHAPEDPKFIDDARAAIRWLTRQAPLPIAVVGYSFGAIAAVTALKDHPEVARALVLISPTLSRHDFSAFGSGCWPQTLVVFSDNDFATPAEMTWSWAEHLPRPVLLKCFHGGEHFFRGIEPDVAACCGMFLESTVPERRP